MFGTKATTLNIGAFLLVLSAIQFAQAAEFGRATNYAVGHAPVFVATGDLNADGVPDLAVANDADGTVSILLGNPDGTFQTAVSYSAGPSPVSIATGDYNGDGAQDLAVANFDWSSQINVLPGNGDGTFRTAVSYSLATYRPSSVVSGDFNGDGALDLAVATVNDSINGGSIAILFGNGDGTFQEAVAYPGGVWALSLVAADFNEDKRLDLAFANYADGFGSSVSVVLGNGDGTFQGMVGYLVGQGVGAIAVGDLTGDGKLDLAVNDNSATCLFGNGDGTFQKSSTSNGTFSNLAVVLADFNKDGKLDVAEWIYVESLHRLSPFASRLMMAAYAPAPNPLSILTTATPGEQVFSMPNSAAMPLKLAP